MRDELQTPNCPNCLHPLQVAGSLYQPYWQCGSCNATAIST